MSKIEFAEEAREGLHAERYEHEHPRVREKMEALYLRSVGVTTAEICRLCQSIRSALAKHLKDYRDGGNERLKEWNSCGGCRNWGVHFGVGKFTVALKIDSEQRAGLPPCALLKPVPRKTLYVFRPAYVSKRPKAQYRG